MKDLPEIPDVSHLERRFHQLQGYRDSLKMRTESLTSEIRELQDEESLLERVVALFQQMINSEIDEAVSSMEELLCQGMQAVFDDMDLRVRSEVGVDRGKVSVSLITQQEKSPGFLVEGVTTESFGQSVATVQSLLLRIMVILRRNLRPMLVLDEALPAFDPNYVGNMGEFLSRLCSRLGLDVLMVTHNSVLFESADKSYTARSAGDAAEFVPVT